MSTTPRPILRIRSPVIGRSEQIFELGQQPVSIGRADDCDIVLLEQSASRLHARLLPEGGGWTLVDEDSSAGVFLGGKRVRQQRLEDGDRFRIGETELQLVLRPGSQPTLVGATLGPSGGTRPAAPADDIGSAPTIASGSYEGELTREPAPSSLSTAPLGPPPVAPAIPRPVPEPIPPPVTAPPVAPAAAAPPMAAPPFAAPAGVASGTPPMAPAIVAPQAPRLELDRPPAPAPQPARARAPGPAPSAPSFVDFGPVGRPEQGGESFAGELAADPSRIGEAQERMSSRMGTWIIVVLLFVGLSLTVLGMAYDITLSDLMSVFE